MKQSKVKSLIETATQIAIGYLINVCMYLIILPWFGFDVTVSQSFQVSGMFTLISLTRLYVIRRMFNR